MEEIYDSSLKFIETKMIKDEKFSPDKECLDILVEFLSPLLNDKEFFKYLLFKHKPLSINSSVNLMFFTSEFLLQKMNHNLKDDVKFFKMIYDEGSKQKGKEETNYIITTYSDMFRHASPRLKGNEEVCKYMLEKDIYGSLTIEMLRDSQFYSKEVLKNHNLLKKGFEKYCESREFDIREIKNEFRRNPNLEEYVFNNYEYTEFAKKILVRR